ncbi:MAG: type VI secretion system baseplate subunit TssG [Rhizobiaceae bacterium]|nr:type VI secretion system baseplate subunit TssG [Rhizobiaceae bacterium]
MTLETLKAEPFRHNFYDVMRRLERETPDKPRIGNANTRTEDIVLVSQVPYAGFASANIVEVSQAADGTPRLGVRFLGMFGPNGPLPMHMTEQALLWLPQDPSFVRFVDIFSTRFLQLFFRAWADARPIAQFDRIADDRFQVYLGSFAGSGTPATRATGPDSETALRRNLARLPFAGLVNGFVKSASRLEQLVRGVLGLDAEVREWTGLWLVLPAGERSSLGVQAMQFGSDCIVGARVHSISDKFRLRIRCRTLAEYEALLPGGALSREVEDLIFHYCGHRHAFELEPGLLRSQALSMQLGRSGRLGLTSWLAARHPDDALAWLWDAHFDPVARNAPSDGGPRRTPQDTLDE